MDHDKINAEVDAEYIAAQQSPITFSAEFRQAMYLSWNAIGADVLECAPDTDNRSAVECCIDADRLLFNGNSPAAHAECKALVAQHGYAAVLDALETEFHFA